MKNEREMWDKKYAEGSHASLRPDPFLREAFSSFVHPLFPRGGSALDVAGGVGRHALYLARRGWQVTLTDISEIGLAKAESAARRLRLAKRIRSVAADMKEFDGRRWRGEFDLVVVFFYLYRPLFPALMRWLRPGGLLIYKTYTVEQRRFSGGPTHPLHLLRRNELLRAVRGLRILHYRETVEQRGLAELVARREKITQLPC
jgi:tellurite methyltransferase